MPSSLETTPFPQILGDYPWSGAADSAIMSEVESGSGSGPTDFNDLFGSSYFDDSDPFLTELLKDYPKVENVQDSFGSVFDSTNNEFGVLDSGNNKSNSLLGNWNVRLKRSG